MIRRRGGQHTLWEAAMPDGVALLKDDAELARLDQILDDEALVEVVVTAGKKRFSKSATRGRAGTPAEVILRMLVLKHLRNWTFDAVEREVRGNLVYREFIRVYLGKVPDAKTLIRWARLLGPDSVRELHERLVNSAVESKAVEGRKMRLDTTVVEAPIHYPTDSGLLADGVRVLTRTIKRIGQAGISLGERARDFGRSVGRRLLEIRKWSRTRAADAEGQMKATYEKLLAIARKSLRHATSAARTVTRKIGEMKKALQTKLRRHLDYLRLMVPRLQHVVAQTVARVRRGETRADKLISIFEPHAQVLRRGKISKPTEFGALVKVQEAEAGFVTDYALVPDKADAPLLIPAVKRHLQIFGNAPRLLAADRGFYSRDNEDAVKQLGVKHVAIQKTGGKSTARRAHEKQRWFRKGVRWRAAGEGTISVLKRSRGLDRSAYKGSHGFERWIGLGVIAHNLHILATLK